MTYFIFGSIILTRSTFYRKRVFQIRAFSIDDIPARTREGAAIIHMILNNLDKAVAQYPQELVTYGGNGQVFSNWAQVHQFDDLKKKNIEQNIL